MSSTVVEPIGEALGAVCEALAGVRGYTWAPASDLDELPAAVVYLPAISRTSVDAPEDHIGQDDWNLDYPVHFHFDATDRVYTQPQIAEVLEAFVAAVDDGVPFDLDGLVQDAKVVSVDEPAIASMNDRPLWRVDTRVHVLAFV